MVRCLLLWLVLGLLGVHSAPYHNTSAPWMKHRLSSAHQPSVVTRVIAQDPGPDGSRQFIFRAPPLHPLAGASSSSNQLPQSGMTLRRTVFKGTVTIPLAKEGVGGGSSQPRIYLPMRHAGNHVVRVPVSVHANKLYHGAVQTTVLDPSGRPLSSTIHGAASNVLMGRRIDGGFRPGLRQRTISTQNHPNPPFRAYPGVQAGRREATDACVQCPGDQVSLAPRGRREAVFAMPKLFPCHGSHTSLSTQVRILHGPSEGSLVQEGSHQMVVQVTPHQTCNFRYTVQVRKCPSLGPDRGQSVVCSEGNAWGSRCIFSCGSGGHMEGPREVSCEEHQGTLDWTRPRPFCTDPSWCPRPLAAAFGSLICEGDDATDATDARASLPPGAICRHKCYDGYIIPEAMRDGAVLLCTNSDWNQTMDPICIPKRCSFPPSIPHGRSSCPPSASPTHVTGGDVCQYRCDDGYTVPSSQSELATWKCGNGASWNTTRPPQCLLAAQPVADPSDCRDTTLFSTSPPNAVIPTPNFRTSSGSVAEVQCDLRRIQTWGRHLRTCRGEDPELRTVSYCKHYVTLTEKRCLPLTPPVNGRSQCTESNGTLLCDVGCHTGYSWPADSPATLSSGRVTCTEAIGSWDFATNGHQSLPDCLSTLPRTSLLASVKFKVSLPNCRESSASSSRGTKSTLHKLKTTVHDFLLATNRGSCADLDCSQLKASCVRRGGSSNGVAVVTWTVRADFFPVVGVDEETYDEDGAEKAESLLEQVQGDSERLLTVDARFRDDLNRLFGATVMTSSITSTALRLGCASRGYSPQDDTFLCIQCPSGTYEIDGQCEECREGTYQDTPGSTYCHRCPAGSSGPSGARSSAVCTDLAQMDQPAHVVIETHLPGPECGSGYRCMHGGQCVAGGTKCRCNSEWTGRRCHVRRRRQNKLSHCPARHCYFGAPCVLDSHGRPRCLCPSFASGHRCQIRHAPAKP